MRKLSNPQITAKSVEISKCLINKEAGFQDFDLDITKSIGDIARFAANTRQSGTLDDKQLAGIANALKISYGTLRTNILYELEDLGWVQIISKGSRIKKIDENIPPLQDILGTLGKKWEEMEPTEIDRASVNSLSLLSKKPATKEALISELGINDESLETTLEYGEQTSYLGTFKSETLEEDVVWTPLYWAGKMDEVLKFLNRQTYENFEIIGNITKGFLQYQGRPIDLIGEQKSLINAGVGQGYFPSVAVKDRNGVSHEYIFAATPHFEAEPENDIFEKARLIVSCIRHGQYNAEVTKIRYPVNLLRALRENRLSAHSYAVIQYALLIANRICTYETVQTSYGEGYKVIFIDTPENNLAADIAEEMLTGETPIAGSLDEPEARQLLTKGTFNYSAEQRQIKSAKKISANREFGRLMECMRGSGVTS